MKLTRNTTFQELLDHAPDFVREMMETLKTLRERPDFHPEENAFEHSRIVTERLVQTGDPDLVCAGIFHDIFKVRFARPNPKTGHPTSPGHDNAAHKLCTEDSEVREFCLSLGANPDTVAFLCGQHMRIKQMDQMRNAKQATLRNHPLFAKLETFTLADDMLRTWEWQIAN